MRKSGKIIDIIGVPSDFGANIAGALMGPAAIRTARVHEQLRQMGVLTRELGDVEVPNRYLLEETAADTHYLSVVQLVCDVLKTTSLASLAAQHIPLVLGGDHSIAMGSLAATCMHYATQRIGLLWVDTHADINTPDSTHTGNVHGMPLSVLLGKGHPELLQLFHKQATILPEHIVLVGLRDIDPEEKHILKKSGVTYYTMRDVDEKGIRKIVKEISKHSFKDIDGLHVSFDLDVMNPAQLPGVSTPVSGGLTLREAHLLLEMVHETQHLVAADFVELNPFKDVQGQSALMAVDLICSLFGKTIM